MNNSNIFIFGVPRSGTTWLAKIFDSHHDTILRHEPDAVHATKRFPFVMPSSEIEKHIDVARKYLLERTHDKKLRCVSSTPYFQKSYRSYGIEQLRRTLITAFKGVDYASRGKFERTLSVPDMISRPADIRYVVKSVDSTARFPLFARACPDHKFIYIIRHPCGVFGSRIRGINLGKLKPGKVFRAWLKYDYAIENNFTEAQMYEWDTLEASAWGWTLVNDFVVRATHDLPNVKILRYEDLCKSPLDVTRSLFEQTGLSWDNQTERYINKCISVNPDNTAAYFSTEQNPMSAALRWQKELSSEDKVSIQEICCRGAAGDFYYKQ